MHGTELNQVNYLFWDNAIQLCILGSHKIKGLWQVTSRKEPHLGEILFISWEISRVQGLGKKLYINCCIKDIYEGV